MAPKRGEVLSGPICTMVQNFTPIGATVAEVAYSVNGPRIKQQTQFPAILTYGEYISIATDYVA